MRQNLASQHRSFPPMPGDTELLKEGFDPELMPILARHWPGLTDARDRRVELRRMAQTRIAAMEKTARTQIETCSVEEQTALIADGLTSDAGREFFAQLPSFESLMPRLDAAQTKGLLESKDSEAL